MPVAVSLLALVKLPGTQPIWPDKFAALMAKVDEELTQNSFDLTHWAVVAGWCEEQEEHELAAAFLWLQKRPECRPVMNRVFGSIGDPMWSFTTLPKAITAVGDVSGDVSTVAGAVAVLAERLRRVREAIE